MCLYVKAATLIIIPLVAFWAWGTFQSWASGNAEWAKTHDKVKPLNRRFEGYGVSEVAAYWETMIPNGLATERCYLRLDLLFPLLYGSALACASVIAAHSSPCLEAWALIFAVPPLVGMAADWTENLVQLKQLQRYADRVPASPDGRDQEAIKADAAAALQDDSIAVASRATRIKLYSLVCSALLLAVLVALMLCPASAGRSV